MSITDVQSLNPNLAAAISVLQRSKDDADDVVRMLRSAGLSKIQSMKVLRDHAGISLAEAKRLIHLSPAWADRLEADDRFQLAAVQVANLIR